MNRARRARKKIQTQCEGARGHVVVEGQILIPERQPVVGLNAACGGHVEGGGCGRKGRVHQHRVIPQWDVRGAAVGPDAVEGGPVDPVIFGRIDGLNGVLVEQIEAERHSREVEVGEIPDRRVLEQIIGVV